MSELLAQLTRLELELHHPGVRCSRERLAQLLHPEFHEVGRSGRPYTRGFVIDHLSTHEPPTVEARDFAVQLLADGCALLTFRSAHRAADGSRIDAAWRSSIWQQGAGGWQLRYHQGTPTAAW